MSQKGPFSGFSEPNTIPVPEEFWGLLPDLKGAELKVLLFLFRKVLGFRKREDAVALSQIIAGTGLSRPAVVEAVRRLQERGCLEVRQARTPEGDRDTNVYKLRFRAEGEGVVKEVNHPLQESCRGVVNEVNRHNNLSAATADEGDLAGFLRKCFGRELTAEEMAQVRALEAEGIPEGTIREGVADAFRCRRRADAPPTLRDCLRVVRRRHRKHHPEGVRTLPATGDAGAVGRAAGEDGGLSFPAAADTPGVPALREAPEGPCPAAAGPLSPPDGLQETWRALAECGCDTPPLRRGLQVLAERYSPRALYEAVVEALAYGVRGERLLGYVRRVLERRAADAGEEGTEVMDAGGDGGDAAEDPAMYRAGAEDGPLSIPERGDGLPGLSGGTPEEIWRRALGMLELELTRATFTTWLAGSRCVGWEGDVLLVGVASPQARDWLNVRLLEVVERAVVRAAGRPMRVRFVVEGRDG